MTAWLQTCHRLFVGRGRSKASARRTNPTAGDVMQAFQIAKESALQSEAIAQSRLNNFLVADSIVFLSWATVFGGGGQRGRVPVLISLAVLSSILSILWMGLGVRQGVFIGLRWATVDAIEAQLDRALRFDSYVAALRHTGLADLRSRRFRLSTYARAVSSRSL